MSRDYMTLKLWDVRMDSGPMSVHPVHENLRARVRLAPSARKQIFSKACTVMGRSSVHALSLPMPLAQEVSG